VKKSPEARGKIQMWRETPPFDAPCVTVAGGVAPAPPVRFAQPLWATLRSPRKHL
jgi:hypothetical protein